jgi:hypothetical protein
MGREATMGGEMMLQAIVNTVLVVIVACALWQEIL